MVAEGHHQLAVVEEASRGSHDALVGGREWWPSTRGGQPRMAASSNRRREYEAEARPSQTDTAQRACTPVARHVNPSHCQGYSVLTLRACTRTRGACVRRGEV